jgi:transposase-like protein
MPTKRHSAEQVVRKLREAEVELAKGATVKDACRKLAITEHTYYRWRREYGGLKLDQARRLKQLEKENARLKKIVAEKELDLSILKEVAEGNFWAQHGGVRRLFTCEVSWAFPSGVHVGC